MDLEKAFVRLYCTFIVSHRGQHFDSACSVNICIPMDLIWWCLRLKGVPEYKHCTGHVGRQVKLDAYSYTER